MNAISNNQMSAAQMLQRPPMGTNKPEDDQEKKPAGMQRATQESYTPSQEALSALSADVAAISDTAVDADADADVAVDADVATDNTDSTSGVNKTPNDEFDTDRELATQLKIEQAEQQIDFLNMICGLFSSQCINMERGDGVWAQIAEGNFEVSETTSAKAAAAIADDGYWGVEQTSTRMFEFAQALTGGDASKAEEMKEYFLKGYEEAEKAWGGELPAIAQETKEATLALFDEWAASANTDVATDA